MTTPPNTLPKKQIPSSQSEITLLHDFLGDWELFEEEGIQKIKKSFVFQNYREVLNCVQKIGVMAEEQNHHPRLVVEFKMITVVWWSHDITGLNSKDFICAQKTDILIQNSNEIIMLNQCHKLPLNKYSPGVNKKPLHHMEHYHLLTNDSVLNQSNFKNHNAYLYGIDLFNGGFYWETHEIMEDIWNKAGRKSAVAKLVQSIIFFAAGRLKQITHQDKSAQKHFQSAIDCFPQNEKAFLGLDRKKYFAEIERVKKHTQSVTKITFSMS